MPLPTHTNRSAIPRCGSTARRWRFELLESRMVLSASVPTPWIVPTTHTLLDQTNVCWGSEEQNADLSRVDLTHVDLTHMELAPFDLAPFDHDFCQQVVQALDEQGMVPRTETKPETKPGTEGLLDDGGEALEFVQFPGFEFMGAGPVVGSDGSGRNTTQLDPSNSQGAGIGQHESAPPISDPGGEHRSVGESTSPVPPSNDDSAYETPTLSEPGGWYAAGDGGLPSSSTAPVASDRVGPFLPESADSTSTDGLQEPSRSTKTESTWHSRTPATERGASLDIGVAPTGGVSGLANLSGDVARASFALSPLTASHSSAEQGSTWHRSTSRSPATNQLPGTGRFFTASATVPPLTLQHETARDPHVEFVLGRTPSHSAPASPAATNHAWALHGPPSAAINGQRVTGGQRATGGQRVTGGPRATDGSPTRQDAASGSTPRHETTLPSANRRVALVTNSEPTDQPVTTEGTTTMDSSANRADRADSPGKTMPLAHPHQVLFAPSEAKQAATPVASLAWLVAWRPIVSKLMLWGFSSCLLLPQVCRSRRPTV